MQIFLILLGSTLSLAMLVLALIGNPSHASAQTRLKISKERLLEDTPLPSSLPEMERSVVWRDAGNRVARFIPNHVDLQAQLSRTGFPISLDQYVGASAGLFLILFLLLWAAKAPLPLALGVALLIAILLPKMVINNLIRRRVDQFISRLPDALDLMVRGLRSGFPISEVIDLVGAEFNGPISVEFSSIGDKMRIGQTLENALHQVQQKLNIQEFSFLGIAITIQRRTGGNLGESLNNLSDVLRKRAQMRLKIAALTSEAKASGYVVGALPFLVTAAISYTNPGYLAPFLTDPRLTMAGIGGLIWMGIGGFIMAKMADMKI